MKVLTVSTHETTIAFDRMEIKEIAEALEKFVGKEVKRYSWNQSLKVQFSMLRSILYDEPVTTTLYYEGGEHTFTEADKGRIIEEWRENKNE